jgi:charged multivesicular body protein 4A/B
MLNRETHLQKKIKAQLLDAKNKSQLKDKKGALFALKRKKMYEGEINKINGARMTLEQQVGLPPHCCELE